MARSGTTGEETGTAGKEAEALARKEAAVDAAIVATKEELSHICHLSHATPESDIIGIFAIFAIFAPMVKNQKKHLVSFPVDCLPGGVRQYTVAVSESLQVPADMVASFVFAVLSLCIQGKYSIRVKADWVETLNLYVLVVARPSERKSPTLKEVFKPVFRYVKEENERRKSEISEYEIKKRILSGKLKNIQDTLSKPTSKAKYTVQDAVDCQKELDELEEVTKLQMILDDVTPEALVKAMKANSEKMGIISAEGGIFGMMAGRYSNNTNIDIFLKSYSGEYFSSVRVGSGGITLENPLLTVCLAAQPQLIADIMDNKEFRGRGLLARFLYSIPNSMVGSRTYRSKPIDQLIRADYENLVEELLNIPDLTGFERVIRLSPEADALSEQYNQWIERQLTDELEEIEDWAGKLHGNTMRIAGILHVVKHKSNAINVLLEEDTMKSAIEIGKYYLEHSKQAFDIMGLSDPQEVKDAKYIISRIDSNSKNSKVRFISKRDAFDLCKGHFGTVEEMEPGLKCLEEHGYIAIKPEKSGRGRPSEKIYINPEYYKWKEKQNVKTR